MRHHHITHPYPLDPRERHVMHEARLGWRRSRLQAALLLLRLLLLLTAGGITSPAGVLVVPAAVVHVKQQRNDIEDVDVEKHHDHYEVGAGADAALLAREALAGRPERRQGRAPPGRCCVLLGILTFLFLRHFPETEQEMGELLVVRRIGPKDRDSKGAVSSSSSSSSFKKCKDCQVHS